MSAPPRFDESFRGSLVGVAGFGALACALAAPTWGLKPALSIALGSLVAVANLYVLGRIFAALLTRAGGAADTTDAARTEAGTVGDADADADASEAADTAADASEAADTAADASEARGAGTGAAAEPSAQPKPTGSAWLALLAVGKIFALFFGFLFLMRRGFVDPLAVVVGYATLPLGIALGSIVGQRGAQQ
jgi:hypothetical protein